MNGKPAERTAVNLSKDAFDAALLPGMRDRLAEAYRALRQSEQDVFRSVLDDNGVFREGMAHVRNCPLCGTPSRDASLVYYAHGMHIVRCAQCDLVYSQEVINRDADNSRYRGSRVMDAHMALHTDSAYAELETGKARYIVGRLKEACGEGEASLLDIGCSTGAILQAAVDNGWQALGIELNRTAVQIARTRGLEAVEGYFPESLPSGTGPFRVITMLDVLEHAEDPVGFLVSVSGRLSRGGILGVQVPNFNSLLIRIEGARNNNICHGHWSYFTPGTLIKAAAKAGLSVLSIETIISEIDRICAHPTKEIVETARLLSGGNVELDQIDHRWIHDHLLGYKLFGVFVRART
jgi:2-polyprenyl-3-methyl-5-hydroxy-6-metoxy-1,4-benzoquinol methylase